MAISKITGLELPEKAARVTEHYTPCDGRGMPPVPGSDGDGMKGECLSCHALIELRENSEGGVAVTAHLVGGKTLPVSPGTKGVRTAEPSRTYGQKVNFRGNTPSDVADVAPIVMGRDINGTPPKPKMHKGREVPTNGTNAGGLGRAHIVMNAMTDLVGKPVPGMLGERDPRITRAEYERLNKRGRQRYNRRIGTMRDAALASRTRRREFEREHGAPVAQGTGPTAARPFTVPAGSRTAQHWDGSKGGRTVETIERRGKAEPVLKGVRYDAKPSGIKYKSEPVFGRTAGR